MAKIIFFTTKSLNTLNLDIWTAAEGNYPIRFWRCFRIHFDHMNIPLLVNDLHLHQSDPNSTAVLLQKHNISWTIINFATPCQVQEYFLYLWHSLGWKQDMQCQHKTERIWRYLPNRMKPIAIIEMKKTTWDPQVQPLNTSEKWNQVWFLVQD